MTYKEAFKRAVATFVAGATAAPLSAAVLDVSFFKAAGVAGVIAVWNWLGRVAQAWKADNGSSL
jgi:hypothetical protein